MIADNSFICGDCIDVLKEIPDKKFDLCLTDPPYGIDLKGPCGHSQQWGGIQSVNDGPLQDDGFNEISRISKEYIIWGANYFNIPGHRLVIVWDKGPSMYGRSFAECETAECSINDVSRIVKVHPNIYDKQHPTQKPVELFIWCLEKYSKPGDLIIDPFCGSGTTAIACHKTGRRFVCIDKEPKYIEIAKKRYKALTDQTELLPMGAL